ncbi:hypothetical protein ACQEU3_14930 [Spirillospora sp. CA-253888]
MTDVLCDSTLAILSLLGLLGGGGALTLLAWAVRLPPRHSEQHRSQGRHQAHERLKNAAGCATKPTPRERGLCCGKADSR